MTPSDDLRSKSYSDGRLDIEIFGSRPAGLPQDFRSYSTPHAGQVSHGFPKEPKGKAAAAGSSSGSVVKGVWCLGDPELQRKKRVAGYKAYAVEGKVKGSFRKGWRWVSKVINGWR